MRLSFARSTCVLMHFATVRSLRVIHTCVKGFEPVTLEEAQSDAAYEGDPDAGSQFGGTLLEQWMDARKIKYPPVMAKPYKEIKEICQ